MYDIFSMLTTLQTIQRLSINNIVIKTAGDPPSTRKELRIYETRAVMFLGEGILFCSIQGFSEF